MGRDGAADRRRAGRRDVVGRRRARGLGHEQVPAVVEVEAERRSAGGRRHDRRARDSVVVHRISVDRVRRLLRHHEQAAVRGELDLRRAGAAGAERAGRPCERRQRLLADGEAADAVAVQDVEQVPADRRRDRVRAAGRDGRVEREPVRLHVEERDGAVAGVDREELPAVVAQDHGALRAERGAGAEAAGRIRALCGERTVGRAREGEHRVAGGRIGEGVHRSRARVARARGRRDGGERDEGEARKQQGGQALHVLLLVDSGVVTAYRLERSRRVT